MTTEIKPIDRLNEWFFAAEHGIKGKGWKYGCRLITRFSDMHKILEDIMGRPVWTSEMAKSNQDNLRKELEIGEKGYSFIEQMKTLKDQGKLLVVVHEKTGEDLSKMKSCDAKPEDKK